MKPKNTNARKQQRRRVALANLSKRRPFTREDQAIEAANLGQALRQGDDNHETKKHMANASFARRQHFVGKLTR